MGLTLKAQYAEITTQSPEVTSFERFSFQPVSLMTGTPSVEIPIFKIVEGEISHNISLKYHGGGIRVNDIASWVGLGWNLDVGGYVTRSIRGDVDEGSNGYYNGSYFLHPYRIPNACIDPGVPGQTIINRAILLMGEGKIYDKEPDLFSYKVDGVNGKFIFNKYGQPQLFPKKNIKISTYGNSLNEFVIYDESGNKYYFGTNGQEKHEVYSQNDELVSLSKKITWYLNKIESKNGFDYIKFTYKKNTSSYATLGSEIKIRSNTNLCNTTYPAGKINRTVVHGFILSKIESNKYKINFDYNLNREDLKGGAKLNSILVKNKQGEHIKRVVLKSSYFSGTAGESPDQYHKKFYKKNHYDTKRLRLDAVEEIGSFYRKTGKHTFKYYEDIHLPRRISFAQDFSGLYNGIANTKLTPKIPQLKQCSRANLAVREPRWPNAKAFILEEVNYPTGGQTRFVYEPNKLNKSVSYNIPIWNDESLVANDFDSGGEEDECIDLPRKTSIESPELTYKYLDNPRKYIGISSNRCNIGADRGDLRFGEKYYVKIRNISTNTTSKTKHFRTDGYGYIGYDEFEIRDFGIKISEGDRYKIYFSMVPPPLETRPMFDMRAYVTHYSKGSRVIEQNVRGIRLKEQHLINENDTIIKNYDYHRSGVEMGFGQTFFHQLTNQNNPYFINGRPCANPIKISGHPNIDLISLQGNYIGYRKVSEITDGVGFSTTTFNENYFNQWVFPGVGNDYLNYEILGGSIKLKEIYNNNGELVKKEEYEYEIKDDYALDIQNGAQKGFIYSSEDVDCFNYDGSNKDFTIHQDYNFINNWITKTTSTFTNYNRTGSVTNKKIINRDSEFHRQPTEEITFDSNGNKIIKRTVYTNDIRVSECDENLKNDMKIEGELSYLRKCISSSYSNNKFNCTSFFECWEKNFSDKKSEILAANNNYLNCLFNEETYSKKTLYTILNMQLENINKPIESTRHIAYKNGEDNWGEEFLMNAIYYSYSYDEMNLEYKLEKVEQMPIIANNNSFSRVSMDRLTRKIHSDELYQSKFKLKHKNDRIIEVISRSKAPEVYLWGHGNLYPVVKIIGLTYDKVVNALGEDFIEDLNTEIDLNKIFLLQNEIRVNQEFKNSFLFTYQYKVGVGMIKQTDPKGLTTTYEYDDFNRLKHIKDHNGDILEAYDYHYKNE